jgi:TPR repeat protein
VRESPPPDPPASVVYAATGGAPRPAPASERASPAPPSPPPAKTGKPVEPSTVAQSAALPPPATTATAPPVAPVPDAAQVLAMMKRAEGLAALGDLSGARLFWERLALQGHKEAALMLARSYDGAWLRGQGVVGVPADPVRAAYWYDRAGVGVGGQAKP